MILALLLLSMFQDPAPADPPIPSPVVTPPAQDKPTRSLEDRMEGRIAVDPAPVPEAAPVKPPEDPNAGWTQVNGIWLIVNEEPLTKLDIMRGMQQRAHDQKRAKVDAERLQSEEVTTRARNLLTTQGGKDMGFDSKMIDQIVNGAFDRQAEEAGSVTNLAATLKSEDKDSFARREEIYTQINSELWTRSITGMGQGPGGRAWRDRFVRPGRALFDQRAALTHQGANRTVQLTLIVLAFGKPAAPGSQERVQKEVEALRVRIENGEDMGELAELSSAVRGKRGLTPQLPISNLRRDYPQLGEFVENAAVGELSPVLPYFEAGQLAGYALVRPEEFKLPPVQPFDEAKSQLEWMQRHRDYLDRQRTEVGLERLKTAAYIWPPLNLAEGGDQP